MQPIDERPSVAHDDAPFTMPAETAPADRRVRPPGRRRRRAADKVPVLEARDISKYFGRVIALEHVSLSVRPGEVNCLLGDNGAGKSTLIKTLSGVHPPDTGSIYIDGQQVTLQSPRDALDRGIATVYQDLAVLPLMSISRNFFVGSEPTRAGARSPAST